MSRSDPRPVRNGVDRNEVIVHGAVLFRRNPLATNDEVYDSLKFRDAFPLPSRTTWKYNGWAAAARRLSGTPGTPGRPKGATNLR